MWAKVNQRVKNQLQRQQKSSQSQPSDSDNQNQQYTSKKLSTDKKPKYSYSDSDQDHQSQSDQSEPNQQIRNLSQSSSESEDSDDDSLDLKNKAKRLDSLREESDQEQQSIDYIEERIKKLEKDLEERLDKHKAKPTNKNAQNLKKNVQNQNSEESGRIISMRKQPPVPPKKKQLIEEDSSSLPETQINFKSREKASERQQLHENEGESKRQSGYEVVMNKKKQVKQNSQDLSNMVIKKAIPSSLNSPVKGSKKKISSKIVVYQKSQPQITNKPTIQRDLKKLNKQIGELRKENRNLKEELSYYKKKKRPAEEVERLRELSEQDTKKLQKELELLKVLERLQGKLKNSIERKLGKGSAQNKMTKQAALLHKGLPSNILN